MCGRSVTGSPPPRSRLVLKQTGRGGRAMGIPVQMTVNGKPVAAEIEPRTLLTQFLRDHLRLTGTHVGCDTSQCGACTVHVDGRAVKACTMLAVQADGASITTIEGMAASADEL